MKQKIITAKKEYLSFAKTFFAMGDLQNVQDVDYEKLHMDFKKSAAK